MTNQTTNRWLGGKDNPEADARLFCFSFAGAGTLPYGPWIERLPSWIEVRPVRLPGRESRFGEPCYQEAVPLAKAMFTGIESYLDRPFAIFGHSLGALVAFEFARELRRQGSPGPFCLMISGRRAPHLSFSEDQSQANLSDPELMKVVRDYGGTPELVLREPELMELFLPVIRADFTITDEYTYTPEPPLDYPIRAFHGETDSRASKAEVEAWKEQTTRDFGLELFPGGHFYLNESSQPALLRRVIEVLETYRPREGV